MSISPGLAEENRVGQSVTCAKLVNLETMLITPGKILETSTSPMACPTQLGQSVPDARRLFLNWGENVKRRRAARCAG
jgi:hypothetical protein